MTITSTASVYRLCMVIIYSLGMLCWLSITSAQPDKWPEFELPVIPEDKDGAQVRLSRIRDSYLAVNKNADPEQAAELLVGEALTAKGYPPEQVMAMQQILGMLVKAGVVTLHAEKLPTANISMLSGNDTSNSTATVDKSKAGRQGEVNDSYPLPPPSSSSSSSHRQLLDRSSSSSPPKCPICDCSSISGGTTSTSSPKITTTRSSACARTRRGCSAKAVAVQAERMSILRTMQVVGHAMRKAAAARSFVLYLKSDVGSYEEYAAMTKAEQEATRAELAGQLLVTCKQYGLSGEDLQKYAPLIGIDVPDLTKTSDVDLKALGSEMASTHALQRVAQSMGKELTVQALVALREKIGDAALRKIGIEPSPELDDAFAQFTTQASRFITLSRAALEAKGVIDPKIQESYANVTSVADRIASTLETVNVTDALLTATKLMIKAEPYLNATINSKSEEDMKPWELILRLSQLQKAMDQQRRSFSYQLPADNELQGLLLLNQTGQAANNPLMQSINLVEIQNMTADGALNIDELRYLVERVGALSDVYSVDDFATLMGEVETNYRALHNLPPVGISSSGNESSRQEIGLSPQGDLNPASSSTTSSKTRI